MWVRVSGPWRLSKLRLVDDTTRSRGPKTLAACVKAHRAAGFTPLEACIDEVAVQSFRLGLPLHRHGPRNADRAHAGRYAAAAQYRRRARRSEMRLLVHEPMKAEADRERLQVVAGLHVHVGKRTLVSLATRAALGEPRYAA